MIGRGTSLVEKIVTKCSTMRGRELTHRADRPEARVFPAQVKIMKLTSHLCIGDCQEGKRVEDILGSLSAHGSAI